jgi:hypothetical protein
MFKNLIRDWLSTALDILLKLSVRFLFIVVMYMAMLILFGIFGT